MRSIQRKDFIVAGAVDRVHGTKGELKLQLGQKIKLKEWVFLEIQGKPVPFFIESVSSNGLQPIVKLRDMDSVEEAEKYTGLNVLHAAGKSKPRSRAIDLDIVGYEMIDKAYGSLGRIVALEEMPSQLMIKARVNSKEVLIPAVDDFIDSIDESAKTVYLNLPAGMVEL